jgi:sialate O-acetylesterase
MLKKIVLLVFICASSSMAFAKVELPKIFNNNMVLKQKSKVNVWGKASAGSEVRITSSWNQKVYTVKSDQEGKWNTTITTSSAGGPYTISFDDGEKTILNNVLIGEVWLCSGQSNMSMTMTGSKDQPILNGPEIIAKSANDHLRLFTVERAMSETPANDLKGEWKVSSPESSASFSAVAFQFGQMLQKQLNVPVGMIVSAWGGTPIRSWMDASFDEFAKMYPETKAPITSKSPKVLYNAMIAPLIPYTLSGFLWYQGEGDKNTPELYGQMMPALIKEWRSKFGQGDLGYYFVQIAPNNYKEKPGAYFSAYLREAQINAAKKVKRAGVAVTADVGSDQTIHPPNKTLVAERLFKQAMAKTYGVKGVYEGPEYKSMKIQGQKAVLNFKNAGSGLMMKGDEPTFEIAGADKIFHKATAKLAGNSIEVESTEVTHPVAVRYAFKDYFTGNLFNKEGFPATSFRTDGWPIDVKK